ncbi:hypothetical protein KKB55_21660, partial [Myxococcota bacterium]|nr:hypothetical protein [Myxococcota bacterium]MBU1900358.1 hypothetical protein [Myxococcota bacterium]
PPLRFAALPGEPLSAPPLPRASASLLGGPPATIYEIELEGWGACGAGRPWRIFTRALDGLSLPKPEDQDPLAAPLIHARVRWTGLEALGFEALGFEALGFEALLKGPLPWSPRAASRAVEGWYAGGGCAGGDVEAGLYALYDEARCAGPAPRVVLDRCGRLIPLDGACLLDEPTLHRAPQRLDLGGGRWLARLPRAGVAAPPSLEGAWGWVEIYEEGEAGAPPTITRSPPGEAWLFISAAGLVTLESPALRLEGRLAWSATSALEVERLGVDCGAYRALTLTQAPGYLHLSERIEGAGGPRLRRVSAWRG